MNTGWYRYAYTIYPLIGRTPTCAARMTYLIIRWAAHTLMLICNTQFPGNRDLGVAIFGSKSEKNKKNREKYIVSIRLILSHSVSIGFTRNWGCQVGGCNRENRRVGSMYRVMERAIDDEH